jgi:hypothetical protein
VAAQVASSVQIGFGDARLCRVFNTYGLLKAEYGPNLAHSIAVRMGVLAASRRLSDVSTRPPIRLRSQKGGFTVNLIEARRLRFQAAGTNGAAPPSDLAEIESIEILGVEA